MELFLSHVGLAYSSGLMLLQIIKPMLWPQYWYLIVETWRRLTLEYCWQLQTVPIPRIIVVCRNKGCKQIYTTAAHGGSFSHPYRNTKMCLLGYDVILSGRTFRRNLMVLVNNINMCMCCIFSHIQGPAEIPDDFAKQLWVEPSAWGICPWELF